MRKLFLIVLVCSLAGCAQDKWNKQTITNQCLRDFENANKNEKVFTTLQVANICDCMSDKLLAKYKSARESNKDEEGSVLIGKECALEAMTK